ncbi:MAG: N-formylglutamate deformylase [Gammaproteobacteria bacterium]|nr:MAG: N-formylglutamate deformylase [Gammaproteobacteria bacterium]
MSEKSYHLTKGSIPILISMPHNGIEIPETIAKNMTNEALKLVDTDWYLDKLYDFAVTEGAWIINPRYSRYVVDLNRPKDDLSLYPGQDTTELCPTTTFSKKAIYKRQGPSEKEIQQRVHNYWQPYHSEVEKCLELMKKQHGMALLFEAHSIKSEVPRFFDGKLTDFNFGNYNQLSCSEQLTKLIEDWEPKEYSKVINGRFKGGYLTRQYGDPQNGIHSLQLELSQATYMDELGLTYNESKAKQVKVELLSMFKCFKTFVSR